MRLDVIDTQGQEALRESTAAPSIWAMTEGRIGDDRQVLALAQAVGGRVQRVQVRERLMRTLGGRLINSFGLQAPWHARLYADSPLPDVMIAAGGRCASLARWVKLASGGRTKVVIIGRPWARLADFDLVVTTPQYNLPARRNVQTNLLPLNCIDTDPEDKRVRDWRQRFAGLPYPWIGVLVGGDSGSFRMTKACARSLAERLNTIAARTGGSLLISTSSRTPRSAIAVLASHLSTPHHLHVWQPEQIDNPHTTILALSDRLVVTGESASMIAEAVNTAKRVELFDLRERRLSRLLTRLPRALGLEWLMRLGAVLGYWTPPRDMSRLHAALAQGRIAGQDVVGVEFQENVRMVDRDLTRTAARIRQLLVADPAEQSAALLALPTALQGQTA